MNNINLKPISITNKAAKEIENLYKKKNISKDYALRIIAMNNGCNRTMNYRLGFDLKKEDDLLFKSEGISIVIEKKQVIFLIDLEIDYQDNKNENGFFFNKI